MSRIIWDQEGQRFYETGAKQGVLYVKDGASYKKGVPWNGLVGVTESPTGAEATPIYADDIKYLNLMSTEEFGATIEAYTYPDEFEQCDGTASLGAGVTIGQQKRKQFGLSYRTTIGNDTDGDAYGYKIHIIYGALAAPSEKGYQTINDSPEAITFSWEVTTTPVLVEGMKPTASLVIDSTKISPEKLTLLENILYGTANSEARLPLPDEIKAIIESTPAALTVTSTPAEGAIDAPINDDIVLTFNNKISHEHVLLMTADGVVVEMTKSLDATGKILTIDPKAPLDSTTEHMIVLSGVADVYGQSLTKSVIKFTTV